MIHHKTLFVLSCLCAAPALAQGSVTIYGALDAGPQYVSNIRGDHRWMLGSGGMQPERFGLRGSEDLGGGLKADFRLESGLLSKSGTNVVPNRFWNREASVGLSGAFGAVRFGRLPDLMYEYIPKYLSPPALTAIVNKHPGNWDNYASQFQFSNTVMYTTPTVGGLQAGVQYGLGEQAGDSKRDRNTSLGVTWTAGPWRTALVASEHRNRPVDIAGRMGLTQAFGLGLTPGTPVATDYVRNVAIGSSWRSASYLIGAAYSRTSMRANAQDATQDNIDIGGLLRLSPTQALQATFTHTDFESAKWNQLKLAGIHTFSRRTSAYVLTQFQRASGAAQFAAMQDIGISSTRSQTMLMAGMIHNF